MFPLDFKALVDQTGTRFWLPDCFDSSLTYQVTDPILASLLRTMKSAIAMLRGCMDSHRTNAAPAATCDEISAFRLLTPGLTTALRGALLFALLSGFLVISPERSQAQTESVLHSFCSMSNCADGSDPISNLIPDANGNLYGTTVAGGNVGGACPSFGCGTVFEISKLGVATILYKFSGSPGGEAPSGTLIRDSNGNFYGTTQVGGNSGGACPSDGCGTVFELVKNGQTYTEEVLYAFPGGTSGAFPSFGVVRDTVGNLYFTAPGQSPPNCASSAVGCGLVFKITPAGQEQVLYQFKGHGDGANPSASVVVDARGNLYGTTAWGGRFGGVCVIYGCGTVFKVTPAGKEQVLYRFKGLADGLMPMGSMVLDAKGGLYGTTLMGGNTKNIDCDIQASGCGVVFGWTKSGGMAVLYTFSGYPVDGQNPRAELIFDKQGNLFGTTSGGGPSNDGTVFKLTPTGVETVLHSFSGGADGISPRASLLLDVHGNLYGTTLYGGAFGAGTLFKVVP